MFVAFSDSVKTESLSNFVNRCKKKKFKKSLCWMSELRVVDTLTKAALFFNIG